MSKRQRTTLFFAFFILFFILMIPIVFFTSGYRVDIQKQEIQQRGGLDLEILTKDTTLIINGKVKNSSNLFSNHATLRNIPAGQYDVRIQKPGFVEWKKTAHVQEGWVTKFRHIQLFPTHINNTQVLSHIQDITVSPDKTFALVRTAPPNKNTHNLSVVTFEDTDITQVLTFETHDTIHTHIGVTGTVLVQHTRSNTKSHNILVFDHNNPLKTQIWNQQRISIDWEKDTVFLTNSLTRFFILKPNRLSFTSTLYATDYNNAQPTPITDDITAITNTNNHLFFIDHQNNLYKLSHKETEPTLVAKTLTLPATPHHMKVYEQGKIIIFITSDYVAVYQPKQDTLIIPFTARDALLAPDHNKIVMWNNNTLTMNWLKDVFGPPSRTKGESQTITHIQDIHSAEWLDDNALHLVIQHNSRMSFLEIDKRDAYNIATYPLSQATTRLYAPHTQSLITLIQNNLFIAPLFAEE